MSELHTAILHLADHVQMPAAERTRLNEALATKQEKPERKAKAKKRAA